VTSFSVLSSEERGGERTTSLSLLDRARNQDQEAWERLVYLYAPVVFHWCHLAGLDANTGDDVWQDVLLTVSARLGSFDRRREGSFRSWLWSITRSRIVDLLRRLEPRGQGGTTALEFLERFQAPTPHDSAEAESEEIDCLFRRALELIRRDFAETTWQAFRAYVLEGRTAVEVAAETGISANAVRLIKPRVLRRLREEFRDFLE
jgi:RNA polymerase sigma-70 factor (ECF subfamily)